jgi:hypothetical protein
VDKFKRKRIMELLEVLARVLGLQFSENPVPGALGLDYTKEGYKIIRYNVDGVAMDILGSRRVRPRAIIDFLVLAIELVRLKRD